MNVPIPRSILLVEDNEDDEELTILALRESQLLHDIFVAHDGADALDFLWARGRHADRFGHVLPEIVLLDLKLPKLNGLEVLQSIRADHHLRRLPVIILTSSLEQRDITSSYDSGANSYIRKPIDFGNFLEAIRQLSLYWLELNEGPRLL